MPSSFGEIGKVLHSVLHHEERENDDGFEVLVVVLSSWMSRERVFVLSNDEAVAKAVSEARRFVIARCERKKKKKNRCVQSRQGG